MEKGKIALLVHNYILFRAALMTTTTMVQMALTCIPHTSPQPLARWCCVLVNVSTVSNTHKRCSNSQLFIKIGVCDMENDGVMNARADAAFDALSNWYENSLNAGAGFKSEEERQEYIKSLGDPMKHPMFAETTEDLEGHPLTEAFRALREEDKTTVELAAMYKEEGNDWIRKNTKKGFEEAYDRYSHALVYLDRAIVEKGNDTENKITEAPEALNILKSQMLSNRAMASLSVANYASCRKDCEIAVRLHNGNLKAHFRRCKALYMLKQHYDCVVACGEALVLDQSNKDILSFQKKSKEELSRRNAEKTATRDRVVSDLTVQYASVWKLAQKEEVALGRCSAVTPPPVQLRDSLPGVDEETKSVCWPVLILYPQYNTLDIIQAAGGDDMLVEHLAVILPEKGDYEQPIEWDRDDEYQASNVVVYAVLHSAQRVTSQQQWVDDCLEHHMIVSGDTTTAPLAESKGLLGHSHVILEDVKKGAIQREQQFQSVQASLHGKQSNHISYFEVHLGCTITQILRSPGHVAAGGILSLIVFPRDNAAHKRFLKGCKEEGLRIAPLNPV